MILQIQDRLKSKFKRVKVGTPLCGVGILSVKFDTEDAQHPHFEEYLRETIFPRLMFPPQSAPVGEVDASEIAAIPAGAVWSSPVRANRV